ncbi:MAG: serine hydrolase [Candidatus Krumholzibacteriota bacterium]|nr:serine hydrolase [Candidatus Krumholzibacteriota bacterium]
MKYRGLKIIPFAFLTILLQYAPSLAQDTLDSLLHTLPETCESLMKERGWPSLSVAIVHDQDIIFSRAFGFSDIENRSPATTRTIYRAGSITKVFAATMLMQLAERGVVGLEDRLDRYLPQYRPHSDLTDPRPTTLRQLASHTSGLPLDAGINFWHYYSNFLWVVLKGQLDLTWYVSKDELLSSLPTVKLEHIPNEYSHYSNLGFQLLGMALEKAAGKPFEEYIKANILEPLRLSSSGFRLTEEQRSRLAVGYVYLEPNFDRYLAPEWELGCAEYSGGLCTTPEDLARFLAFQFAEGEKGKNPILSADGRRRLRSPQSIPSPGTEESYGLGWGVYRLEKYQCLGHSGSHFGFFARMEALPELKLGIALMTNAVYPQGYIGPEKLLTRILLEKFIPLVETKEPEVSFHTGDMDLARYAGLYEVAGGYAQAEVKIENRQLYLSLVQQPDFNELFLPVGPHRFCFASDPEKNPMLFFSVGKKGKVTGFRFLSYNFKNKK